MVTRRRGGLAEGFITSRVVTAVGLTALALCVGYLVAWDPSSGTVPAMAEINNKLSANQAVLKDETKYEGRKVQIDFYMESMCPGCRYFGTGDLVNLLNGLTDYVNLRAIPYGNAGVNKTTGELACQHGDESWLPLWTWP